MNHRRMPAEWEKQSFLQLTFPSFDSDWADNYDAIIKCYVDLICAIVPFQKVLLTCDPIESVKKVLPKRIHHKIIWAQHATNDTWCRDYGGITVFDGTQKTLLDFTFNGWGNKFPSDLDNQLTKRLFEEKFSDEYTYKKVNIILEGGSIDSNGNGLLLTTSQCLPGKNRNTNLSKEEIESMLINQLGVKKVLWLHSGYLKGDDTDGHIDTLARFVNSDSIFYAQCNNPANPNYESLLAMERELMELTNLENIPFDLYALPLPDPIYSENGKILPATYLNFLFLNGAVLVPTYHQPKDKEVLDFFSRFFPEKEIIGINCVPLIQQGGAIHCASMQYY